MNTRTLRELGEWAAAGFYESLQAGDPWPIPYGKAFRRLYEHMEVRVPPDHYLLPFEPLPNARTRESHQAWCATSLIVDFDHNRGLRVNRDIAEARKQDAPIKAFTPTSPKTWSRACPASAATPTPTPTCAAW